MLWRNNGRWRRITETAEETLNVRRWSCGEPGESSKAGNTASGAGVGGSRHVRTGFSEECILILSVPEGAFRGLQGRARMWSQLQDCGSGHHGGDRTHGQEASAQSGQRSSCWDTIWPNQALETPPQDLTVSQEGRCVPLIWGNAFGLSTWVHNYLKEKVNGWWWKVWEGVWQCPWAHVWSLLSWRDTRFIHQDRPQAGHVGLGTTRWQILGWKISFQSDFSCFVCEIKVRRCLSPAQER